MPPPPLRDDDPFQQAPRGGPGGNEPGSGVNPPDFGYKPDGSLLFGPDGMPLAGGGLVLDDEPAPPKYMDEGSIVHGVELHDQGWFHAASNKSDQEYTARENFSAICMAVDQARAAGLCPEGRWTNDPEVFPDLRLRGMAAANAIVPFPPHDQQFYIRGIHDPNLSSLRYDAIPSLMPDEEGNSTWVRLVDCSDHAEACRLYDEIGTQKSHYGRVIQGNMDNGYFVEALQAVSLRPKLARQLFYCWDTHRSVYVARLHKHGTWMRVEIDDYVPIGPAALDGADSNFPICCRSEFFPHVLWPSLIEKAYAKLHTMRYATSESHLEDRGGWEALGGGGRVEEALADLTGGVAGRFHTCDVSSDRLFLYIYELQRDTVFVCRPHQTNCELHGVRLNPYYPHVVNRAATWEGRLYIQVFCGAPGVFDGRLQDLAVPYGLIQSELYPEKMADGFFWMDAGDFHEYFDTIFECRLTCSGDVALPNMPPPRIPPPMAASVPTFGAVGNPQLPQRGGADPASPAWQEWVFANPGEITLSNEPEFTIRIPEHQVPCEVICSVEQIDPRMQMASPVRARPEPVLCKVYEGTGVPNCYSEDLVCKSNWLAVRDGMVAFIVTGGGEYKIVCELEGRTSRVNRMVFRCYTSKPHAMVTAGTAGAKHNLVKPQIPSKANKFTLVGTHKFKDKDKEAPEALNDDHDGMRKAEMDMHPTWEELKNSMEDCSVM